MRNFPRDPETQRIFDQVMKELSQCESRIEQYVQNVVIRAPAFGIPTPDPAALEFYSPPSFADLLRRRTKLVNVGSANSGRVVVYDARGDLESIGIDAQPGFYVLQFEATPSDKEPLFLERTFRLVNNLKDRLYALQK